MGSHGGIQDMGVDPTLPSHFIAQVHLSVIPVPPATNELFAIRG